MASLRYTSQRFAGTQQGMLIEHTTRKARVPGAGSGDSMGLVLGSNSSDAHLVVLLGYRRMLQPVPGCPRATSLHGGPPPPPAQQQQQQAGRAPTTAFRLSKRSSTAIYSNFAADGPHGMRRALREAAEENCARRTRSEMLLERTMARRAAVTELTHGNRLPPDVARRRLGW